MARRHWIAGAAIAIAAVLVFPSPSPGASLDGARTSIRTSSIRKSATRSAVRSATTTSLRSGFTSTQATTTTARSRGSSGPIDQGVLKLVNYYPSRHGWTLMWEQWDPTTIWSDFARIHAMGANAVRLILPAGTIGYPQPRPVMLGRIAQAVDFADRNGLRVELTLFDLWSGYADLTGSRTWASAVLGPFKGDPRVALVEIQNEVNPANQSAVSWARAMLGWTRTFARLPVTISAKGDIHSFDALVQALGTVRPDVYSFHFYASDASVAPATFYWAGRIAAPTPVFIGETGLSTADSQTATVDPTAEHAQDVFFQKVEGATAMLGLPPAAPWTLWDFAPGTLCACAPGYEYHFGLLRLDGSPKPAYTTIKRFFSTGLL